MNVWQFFDKQFDRLKVEHVAGCGVFCLTVMVFVMIQQQPKLAENDLFKMLAQAVVVQGLVGLAMAAWFTTKASNTVRIEQPPNDPVPVKEE